VQHPARIAARAFEKPSTRWPDFKDGIRRVLPGGDHPQAATIGRDRHPSITAIASISNSQPGWTSGAKMNVLTGGAAVLTLASRTFWKRCAPRLTVRRRVVDLHDVLEVPPAHHGGVGILEHLLDLGCEVTLADELVVTSCGTWPAIRQLALGHLGDSNSHHAAACLCV